MRPPKADIRPSTTSRHGDSREDNYAWLRDANWQEVMKKPEVLAPDIRTYLEDENDQDPHDETLREELPCETRRRSADRGSNRRVSTMGLGSN